MLEAVNNVNPIVRNTPNNIGNYHRPAPIVFMADLEVIGDYKPVAHNLRPLEQDVFERSFKKENSGNAQVSFLRRVARFFGLK